MKIEDGKKIKDSRISDNSICVSLVPSNVSHALQVRMSVMPMKFCEPAPQNAVIQSTPITREQIIKEPPNGPNRKTTTNINQQCLSKRQGISPSITKSDESMISTQKCPPTVLSKRTLSPQKC